MNKLFVSIICRFNLLSEATGISILAANPKIAGEFYAINNHGIFCSIDSGNTWKMLDVLVDDLLYILNHVTERLDDIEDDVFSDKIVITQRISLLRRDIVTLSRIAIPLKQIIMEIMTKDIQNLLDEKDIRRQQEGRSNSVNDLVLFSAI